MIRLLLLPPTVHDNAWHQVVYMHSNEPRTPNPNSYPNSGNLPLYKYLMSHLRRLIHYCLYQQLFSKVSLKCFSKIPKLNSLSESCISLMKAYGNICDMKSDFPVYAYRYVCLSGSSSPTPSDGSHGYLCPAGHSCPVGSASEVPCKPGTYSPAPGAAHCLICPNGTMCSSSATQEPSICPTGADGENKPSLFRMNHIISRFSHTTVMLSVDGICFL